MKIEPEENQEVTQEFEEKTLEEKVTHVYSIITGGTILDPDAEPQEVIEAYKIFNNQIIEKALEQKLSELDIEGDANDSPGTILLKESLKKILPELWKFVVDMATPIPQQEDSFETARDILEWVNIRHQNAFQYVNKILADLPKPALIALANEDWVKRGPVRKDNGPVKTNKPQNGTPPPPPGTNPKGEFFADVLPFEYVVDPER